MQSCVYYIGEKTHLNTVKTQTTTVLLYDDILFSV